MKQPNLWRRWRLTLLGMVALGLLALWMRPAASPAPSTDSGAPSVGYAATQDDDARAELNVPADATLYSGTISGMLGPDQWFSGLPVQYALVDGLPMMEGDIILRLDDPSQAGLAVNDRRFLWKGGVVPFEVDRNLPASIRVYDAVKHWESVTRLRFVERSSANASQYPDYIFFQPGSGCSSYVGQIGGRQPINLALACSTGSTIHEIGHAVGLWHEHSRADRDDFVTVVYENIIPAMAFNFNKHISDGRDIGLYDYDSIMHYPRWAFSRNGQDTIIPKQERDIGQRKTLSQGDIDAVHELYRDELP